MPRPMPRIVADASCEWHQPRHVLTPDATCRIIYLGLLWFGFLTNREGRCNVNSNNQEAILFVLVYQHSLLGSLDLKNVQVD